MTLILDVSHHQDPTKMNYKELADQIDMVIIRTQYGSRLIDRHYKTHHQSFQKYHVPTAAYAWVRGVSSTDMKKEATDFYHRTKEFNPCFWFLDVEEQSMTNMRKGIQAYVEQLRALGAHKIGIYTGHHLYKKFNLDYQAVDAIWLPHYGRNDGTINSTPSFPCDIHQYTDKGTLRGYNGNLDLNQLIGNKPISYFTGNKPIDRPKLNKIPFKTLSTNQKGERIINIYPKPVRFYDTPRWTNPTGTFAPGEGWIITGKYLVEGSPMYEVKNSKGAIYYITANSTYVAIKHHTLTPVYHIVQAGDTVSQLALRYNTTISHIQALNNLKNIHKIYVGDRLRIK